MTLADRVNYCFTRSLGGNRLSSDSREMADMLAYIAWLSSGVPIGAKIPGSDGMPQMKQMLATDTARGAALYTARCQVCHQANGAGNDLVPALWGGQSYAVGASMARLERAATFIAHNMPLGQGGSLSDQEAFDIAAYVNSHARPDSPGKEKDFPYGGAPKDLPYTTTSGHKAFNGSATVATQIAGTCARSGSAQHRQPQRSRVMNDWSTDEGVAPTTHKPVDRAAAVRLQLALAVAGLGTWDWDPHSNQITWNDAHERLCGFLPGTFSGKADDYFALVVPEDRPLIDDALRRAREDHVEYRCEYRIRRHNDGAIRWLVGRGAFLYDNLGRETWASGIIADITERKQVDAAVRVTEQRRQLLFERNPLPMMVVDAESRRYLEVNDAAVRQ